MPSQPEHPGEQAKAITLKSGKQLPKKEATRQENGVNQEIEVEQQTEVIKDKMEEKKATPPKTPVLPFPQRQQKSKLDKQFEKFIKSFQQLKLNIPLWMLSSLCPHMPNF